MMKKHTVPAAAFFLFIGSFLQNVSAADHNWDTYANPKYGYTICWPQDLLKAQRVSDSGDGREFKGARGVIMRAYGSYRVQDVPDTFASKVADAAKNLGGEGAKVTYQKQSKDWIVASGTGTASGMRDATIFYTKTFLRKDTWKTFEIVYPQSEAAVWNPVAAHIAGCFFSGEGEDEDR